MKRKVMAALLSASLVVSMAGCGTTTSDSVESTESAEATSDEEDVVYADVSDDYDQDYIEETLNLANNEEQEWTYSADADAWTLSIVMAVAYPEVEDEQGVSVCVPGAYVTGIDTDGDGEADVTAEDAGEDAVQGSLVIDYEAEIVSSNGQTYTAATAPCILNTGAAGYSEQENQLASTEYASEGYINIACGNRGKQSVATDEDGNEYYTGDAPDCLVDQKNAIRYVKYNILLGNLPGNTEYFVSTGGSGGGAHATMVAATSNNSDFYNYEIEAGAVGVYQNEDGSYSTTVTVDGVDYELSDGVWGCIAYSAITSLAEADMAMAFEYYLDVDYEYNTDFQAQMAEYLAAEYMEYINEQNLTVEESAVGFDLNGDGDTDDVISLTIEYDEDLYADTHGYGGTYVDLYLAEFTENLQWYLDNLDYADGWTWFDEDGNALSDEEVAAMTTEDKAEAFLEGRYAKSTSTGGMDGAPSGDMTGGPGGDMGDMGDLPDDADGEMTGGMGGGPSDATDTSDSEEEEVGTPDAGTTQSASSTTDSANYETFEEMLEAYEEDIAEIEAGDKYGNNIVELYNPLNYIGDEDTDDVTWIRIVNGAAEGDISMFNSLNIQIAALNAGIDATIEWQWDGGHVPSETLSSSFSLYVDQMYGEYVNGTTIETPEAEQQTTNGTATEATGTDISSWVDSSDITNVSVTLADAVSYRSAGSSKAVPGFDVMDYGQEDYEFGDSDSDARHWNKYILKIFEEYEDVLSALFNAES